MPISRNEGRLLKYEATNPPLVIRVRDPIHKDIRLDAMGRELVDAPRMQRLRRIHQLGTGNLVYPGANHTRFEHSLGAYHLAGLAADAVGAGQDERKAVMAAALLHDIGHGPFSHTADPLYRDFLRKTHEDVTIDALQKGALADILERHGVKPKSVADLIHGEGPLGRLVSGDLDVDRMDYLVRDSHYTGVHIGVDLARLVGDLALTPKGVAIREGSLPAAEMLLVTRLQMYATVYFHHTLRVAERMIERAFRLSLEAGEMKPEQLPSMDDVGATYLLRHSKTDAWRLMMAVDQRKLHKVALEEPMGDFREDAVLDLSRSAQAQGRLEAEMARELGLAPHDVILDVPDPPTLPEIDAQVLTERGDVVPLADVSSLVRGLGLAQRDHWRLRVMVPASRRADAQKVAGRVLQRELA
jgi:HD superfamily phosphohydrolase